MLDYLPIKGLSIWSKETLNVIKLKIGFVAVDLTELSSVYVSTNKVIFALFFKSSF